MIPEQLNTLLGQKTIAEWVFAPESGGFTGVVPALREFAGETPIVGQGTGIAETLRTTVPLVLQRLTDVLALNPRFSGRDSGSTFELNTIKEKLNLEPRRWDNPKAMLGRLVGVSLYLRSLESELANAIGDLKQPRAQAKLDRASLQLVQAMIERLTPDIITEANPKKARDAAVSFAEANPPGTPVIFLGSEGTWVLKYTTGKKQKK